MLLDKSLHFCDHLISIFVLVKSLDLDAKNRNMSKLKFSMRYGKESGSENYRPKKNRRNASEYIC